MNGRASIIIIIEGGGRKGESFLRVDTFENRYGLKICWLLLWLLVVLIVGRVKVWMLRLLLLIVLTGGELMLI